MKNSHTEYHKNGMIRSTGKLKDGKREGYWKWYRRDGSKLKTGYFQAGKRVKEWMLYDEKGKIIHE